MNFIQIITARIIGKFKCYNIYALLDPFIGRQPVKRLKLLAGYMMSLVQRYPNFVRRCIFFFSFSLRLE